MKKKVVSIVLALVMVVTCVPSYSFSESSGGDSASAEVLQTEKDCSRENALPDESTENMTVFENENGSRTAVIYSENVRFIDEDGVMKDYDPSLTESSVDEYSFENKGGIRISIFQRCLMMTPL